MYGRTGSSHQLGDRAVHQLLLFHPIKPIEGEVGHGDFEVAGALRADIDRCIGESLSDRGADLSGNLFGRRAGVEDLESHVEGASSCAVGFGAVCADLIAWNVRIDLLAPGINSADDIIHLRESERDELVGGLRRTPSVVAVQDESRVSRESFDSSGLGFV
jgi:hypothetical protein